MQTKNKEEYGKFEEGNTLSFDALQEFLDNEFSEHKLNIEEHFMPMYDQVWNSKVRPNPNLNPKLNSLTY